MEWGEDFKGNEEKIYLLVYKFSLERCWVYFDWRNLVFMCDKCIIVVEVEDIRFEDGISVDSKIFF